MLVQPYSVKLTQSRAESPRGPRGQPGGPTRAIGKFALRLGLAPKPSPAYRTIFLGDGGLDADKVYVSPRVSSPHPRRAWSRSIDFGVQYMVLGTPRYRGLPVAPLRAAIGDGGHVYLLASACCSSRP